MQCFHQVNLETLTAKGITLQGDSVKNSKTKLHCDPLQYWCANLPRFCYAIKTPLKAPKAFWGFWGISCISLCRYNRFFLLFINKYLYLNYSLPRYVSHVGLRRIILETGDLTHQLGPDLPRFLLARAEANLYGRLTLAELIMMAQEVGRGVRRFSYGPRSTIHNAAVSLALPLNQEREDKLHYLDQYR